LVALPLEAALRRPHETDERRNNFGALRLLAAIMVIFSHSVLLPGNGAADPFTGLSGYVHTGGLGLFIFFVISGFLVTKSWDSHPNLRAFVGKRALRIMPALIFVTVLSVVVLGPLQSEDSLGTYFTSATTGTFLWRNVLLHPSYFLPGVFTHNPSGFVNGSLWTLPYEVTLYALAPIVGTLCVLTHRRWPVLIALVIVYLPLARVAATLIPVIEVDLGELLVLGRYFVAGAVLYLFRDRIPWRGGIAAGLAVLWVLSWRQQWTEWIFSLVVPYEVIYISRLDLPAVRSIGRKRDLSYGLYLLGFPVQQVIMDWSGDHIGPLALFALALPCTAVLATVSWYLVEAPALSLKGRLPTGVPASRHRQMKVAVQ